MTEVPTHEHLLHLIGKICGRNFHLMTERLKALGLYHKQPHVLNVLWEEEGMTQSQLAEKLHRSPSTITKTVQRMEKAGFVERRNDPQDERISRVYLTEAGREVRMAADEVWRGAAQQAFGSFDDKMLVQIEGVLEQIYENLQGD